MNDSTRQLHTVAQALLRKADLEKPVLSILPIKGGGNNRVYRVETGDSAYLLKAYFHHPDDPRDRLHHEFSFSCFLYKNGIKQIAKPVSADPASHHALYEFIEGQKIRPEQVNAKKTRLFPDFFIKMNKIRHLDTAKELPVASEAYFSVEKHVEGIQNRLKRLKNIQKMSETDEKAAFFIEKSLIPASKLVFASIFDSKIDKKRVLSVSERCLSPSDFGFHNALLDASGQLRFIDFEYAGWDDPAKMAGDFFSQPAVPVSAEYIAPFVDHIIGNIEGLDDSLRQRIELFLPLYRIKWCCIILNDFLQTDGQRRQHALGIDPQQRKDQQLKLATQHLEGLQTLL